MEFLRNRQIRGVLTASVLMASLFQPAAGMASGNADRENVVEKIQRESHGNISIDIPTGILELVLKPSVKKESPALRSGVNKIAGYRIQVFSDGRNQQTLEARAKARGSAILAKFPKYRGQVYSYSSSPNWYTRVGNFQTNSEASAALTEMKRAFPNFASEMRIVKCQIVVIK